MFSLFLKIEHVKEGHPAEGGFVPQVQYLLNMPRRFRLRQAGSIGWMDPDVESGYPSKAKQQGSRQSLGWKIQLPHWHTPLKFSHPSKRESFDQWLIISWFSCVLCLMVLLPGEIPPI